MSCHYKVTSCHVTIKSCHVVLSPSIKSCLVISRHSIKSCNFPTSFHVTSSQVCIAEVEEILEVGELPAEQVHLPGVYVQRLIQGDHYIKRIEVSAEGLCS